MITVSRLSACLVCLCSLAIVTRASVKAQPQPAADANAVQSAASASRLRYPQVNVAGLGRDYRPIRNHATETDEKIRAALAAPCEWQFKVVETSLRELITRIQAESGLPIVIDVGALNDAGIDLDAVTVTQQVPRSMSIRGALRLLLHDVGLTFIAAHEVLTVTTRDEAHGHPVIVTYPLPRGFGDSRLPDFESTINLIHSTVAADTWDCVGGTGTIQPLEAAECPLLVVSQTCDVHEEIESLLRGIHERLLAEFSNGKPVVRVHHVASRDARDSLAESLKEVCNDSLGDAGDPDAAVTVVADSVVILSKSPEFQATAGQVIAAVGGVAPPQPRQQDGSALQPSGSR